MRRAQFGEQRRRAQTVDAEEGGGYGAWRSQSKETASTIKGPSAMIGRENPSEAREPIGGRENSSEAKKREAKKTLMFLRLLKDVGLLGRSLEDSEGT